MLDLILLPAASYMLNGRLSNTPPVRYERMARNGDFESRFPLQAKALDFYARSFSDNDCRCDKSLIISAPHGAGKTCAAIELVGKIKEMGGTSIYLTAQELVMAMLRDGGSKSVDTIQMLCRFQLLILDDVGEEFYLAESEVAAAILFQLINARYAQCLPNCLVTNRPIHNLHEAYGLNQRIMDRIKGEVIEYGWEGEK